MKAFQNILILTDFSPASWQAMKLGFFLAHDQDSILTLLHVFPSMNNKLLTGRKQEPMNGKLEMIQTKLKSFSEEFKNGHKFPISSVVRKGNIGSEVRKYLNEYPCDVVVMGLNSNGGLDSTLGHNTKEIIENSGVPVLVVPNR
ncbi:MAG: universal stress protein [Cyclobacteriaceae bacterium]|nr:universal stress protein [Cyclobacteriaceae bacterium HetDA_MAG_MS6]